MRTINATGAVLALIGSVAHAGTVSTDGSDLIVNTKGGLEVKTADGDYSFKVGGRVQLDYNGYDGVINKVEGETGSDLFFRRGRVAIKGKAKDWTYLASYNLTGSGSIDQLNASYNGWGKMAVLTLGQQKEWFGLDDLGSSKWTTGIERSLPANAFDTGNNVGVLLHGSNDSLTYSIGVFKESVDADDNSLDSAITGRFVYRPLNEDGRLIHLGLGYTLRDGAFDEIGSRLGVRGGEDKTANKVRAEYDGVVGDELEISNVEFAASFGSAHVQAEYFQGEVSSNAAPDLEADGYYLQVGYVITGEKRSYKSSSGTFDKVKPSGAGGAWEVFARYDELDVSSTQASVLTSTDASDANTLTIGANWYMNSNVKLAMNYVNAETDQPIGGEDSGDAIVARFQFLF